MINNLDEKQIEKLRKKKVALTEIERELVVKLLEKEKDIEEKYLEEIKNTPDGQTEVFEFKKDRSLNYWETEIEILYEEKLKAGYGYDESEKNLK